MQVEVDQREVRAHPVMILGDAPVSHLVETEDTLQYAERMFYFGSDSRLGGVLPFSLFVDIVFELSSSASHVLGLRRGLADRFRLALVAAVAPHLTFLAVQ